MVAQVGAECVLCPNLLLLGVVADTPGGGATFTLELPVAHHS
ncbi:MAG: hypothetical protein Q4A71_05405 [Actinomycetaceae bacterium]|nr:hypothetical protein [Actinomycetaceae bacterium]